MAPGLRNDASFCFSGARHSGLFKEHIETICSAASGPTDFSVIAKVCREIPDVFRFHATIFEITQRLAHFTDRFDLELAQCYLYFQISTKPRVRDLCQQQRLDFILN